MKCLGLIKAGHPATAALYWHRMHEKINRQTKYQHTARLLAQNLDIADAVEARGLVHFADQVAGGADAPAGISPRHPLPGFASHIIVVLAMSIPTMTCGETSLLFRNLALPPPIALEPGNPFELFRIHSEQGGACAAGLSGNQLVQGVNQCSRFLKAGADFVVRLARGLDCDRTEAGCIRQTKVPTSAVSFIDTACTSKTVEADACYRQ